MLTQNIQDEEAVQSDATARQPNGGKVSRTEAVQEPHRLLFRPIGCNMNNMHRIIYLAPYH